ncbi:DUF4190 domain-containing protein [Microbacterium sp. 13-71-7]|jgi:hypothetical protein|uniref:DUF4190 domain-containing protein n=1 Tax=Microbacterium sp. 13-71-7 TaxID=1970399 RepID=UPI000BC5B98F|nr:DUF4190 domain-containing protein [Microbacterium sp. 13-71-7]OZB86062.1 MAG: hypothetical protein B7X32_01105 [Microbacterium sp. 13-71-7]
MTYPQDPQPGPPPYQAAPPYPMAQHPANGQAYYPMPAYLAVPEPKGMSIASLVLALVSIVFGFTFLVPVAALILGIAGIRKERAGRGMAVAGVIISSLILLVWALILILFFVIGLSAFGVAVSHTT